jgi:phage baseplate assembly protein W
LQVKAVSRSQNTENVNMKAISVPFRFDGYGNVATSTAPSKIWAGRVRSVLGTPVGQRVMRLDFGSELPNNLFDIAVTTPGFIEAGVTSAASRWLPDIEVVDVEVTDDNTNDVSVNITYQIPESTISGTTYSVRII